ncbi:ASCH domain-containing protein [Streptomyces sp. NPDC057242]|uniref:ASCH domain-containing protein n=1 Tax=Streptomyces sp. NPDC057242 TaxID=3346063 RepID=UPI0036273BD9
MAHLVAPRPAPPAQTPSLPAPPAPRGPGLGGGDLSGEKTATTGLLLEYEAEGEELPEVGERSAVVDSDGREVAVVEITEVQVLPLRDADLRLALGEGEGHRSVAEWRAGHEDFWHGEEMREALGDPEFVVDGGTMLVVEWFRVVEVLRGA